MKKDSVEAYSKQKFWMRFCKLRVINQTLYVRATVLITVHKNIKSLSCMTTMKNCDTHISKLLRAALKCQIKVFEKYSTCTNPFLMHEIY